jgi:hypothetical protein
MNGAIRPGFRRLSLPTAEVASPAKVHRARMADDQQQCVHFVRVPPRRQVGERVLRSVEPDIVGIQAEKWVR